MAAHGRPRGDGRLAEHQLVGACRGRIAGYKIPRYWKFVESFPMTVTGKARKFLMRQAAIEELGRRTGKEAVAA
jgi:fatty-acyl-CoA synthase